MLIVDIVHLGRLEEHRMEATPFGGSDHVEHKWLVDMADIHQVT